MLVHAQQHAGGDRRSAARSGDRSQRRRRLRRAGGRAELCGPAAEALEAVEKAMRLNPHYPSSYAYQRGLRCSA
jgi:hypothetical protein